MTERNVTWTDQQVEHLRRLYDEGLSYALIGATIGMSRCACIGKARRIGLPMRVVSQTVRPTPKPKAAKRPYVRVVRASGNSTAFRLIESVETDLPQFQCEVIPLNKTLDELRGDECRYIAGDPLKDGPNLYCGREAKPGSSYCLGHHYRVWVRPEKRFARRAA
jgi:hypothetical protein